MTMRRLAAFPVRVPQWPGRFNPHSGMIYRRAAQIGGEPAFTTNRLALRHCRKVRADDVDQPVGRGAGREEADIFAAGIDQEDETGVVEFRVCLLRRLVLAK